MNNPIVMVSKDGRNNSDRYEIDAENSAPPHLVISKQGKTICCTFVNDAEKSRYYSGIGLCRAVDKDGVPIYLTSMGRK